MRLFPAILLWCLAAESSFGMPSAELRALFTPRPSSSITYEVFTSNETIDVLSARMRAGGGETPEGAWVIERQDPFDAFGSDGRYDRYRMAQLYGGTRPRVARGPLVRDGRALGSVVFISPYPNARMTELVPGTLTIVAERRAGSNADRSRP